MTENASAQACTYPWTLGMWNSEQEWLYIMKGGNITVLPYNLKCLCLKLGVQNPKLQGRWACSLLYGTEVYPQITSSLFLNSGYATMSTYTRYFPCIKKIQGDIQNYTVTHCCSRHRDTWRKLFSGHWKEKLVAFLWSEGYFNGC